MQNGPLQGVTGKFASAWPVCVLLSALLVAPLARAQLHVRIDGSSTMFPVTEAVAQEFQIRKRGMARVTVGISGTSGGFRKFCRGETDIQDASRPILKSEMENCRIAGIRFFEFPVAFDALTVAVHPQNTWLESITVEELRRIWEPAAQGRIVRWKQINSSWPDVPIFLYGADADSGTFDYFTQAVVGRAKASRVDYTGSENDNILVKGIEANLYSLGYIPYAYYAPHAGRMKALAVDAGSGPVAPGPENVLNGSYAPLSRPLFIYVNAASAKRPEVREFVEFFLAKGAPLIREVRYLPLAEEAYAAALRNFRHGKLGTAFNGEPEVGLRVEEVLERNHACRLQRCDSRARESRLRPK
jgi:phosphate transport system substrate-binding protein